MNLPDPAFHRLLDAVAFAARAHHGQLRKDGVTPYHSHVFRVCLVARHVFGVEDIAVLTAAVLHDTIEDTTTDFDDVQEQFGPEIAGWVALLSKDKRQQDEPREQAYCAGLHSAPWQVKICKLADIYDNLTDSKQQAPSGGPRPMSDLACIWMLSSSRIRSRLCSSAHQIVSALLEQLSQKGWWIAFLFLELLSTRNEEHNTSCGEPWAVHGLAARVDARSRSHHRWRSCSKAASSCCCYRLSMSCRPISSAAACPFCNMDGKTLTGEVKDATMVLFGELTNADAVKDTTDIVIDSVVKKPEKAALLGDGKKLTLRGFHPPDPKGEYRWLVFCDEFKNGIDPYYAVAVKKDSDIAKYLKGALDVRDEKQPKRLRFFFDYLDNADVEISNDALKEFGKADYADYKDMAKTLPADKIAGWLKDDKTPAFRYGLYASLLGHCGTAKHAALLRDMLDDKDKLQGAGVDGIMAAYTMLKPKEGFAFITECLKDPKKHFMIRYNALKAIRFMWDYRPDMAKKEDMATAVSLLLEQDDLADMGIEDLRRWKQWDMADRILGLRDKKVFETPIVRPLDPALRHRLQGQQELRGLRRGDAQEGCRDGARRGGVATLAARPSALWKVTF